MKTRILSAIAVAAAALSVACTPEEKVIPEFPETMDDITVNAGETATVTINPNMAWEAVLSASTSDFWFGEQDETLKRKSISGEAGETVLRISVTDEQPYNEPVVCDLTLTMGGESKRIVTMVLMPVEGTFAVYPAVWDETTGLYKTDDSGKYIYASEKAETVELNFTKEDGSLFHEIQCPVKIVANFDWIIKTSDAPEWLSPIEEQKSGSVEVILRSDVENYPAETNTVTVSVTNLSASDANVGGTFDIMIPDYRQFYFCSNLIPGETFYVENTGFATDTPYRIYSDKDIAFIPYSYDGSVYTLKEADWITVERISEWDESDAAKMRMCEFNLTVAENDSNASRKGGFVVVTSDRKAEFDANNNVIFSSDHTEIAAGFDFFPVEQDGKKSVMEGILSTDKKEEELADMKVSFAYETDKSNWMYKDPEEVEDVYHLTYGAVKTSVDFNVDSSVEDYSVEIMHSDYKDPNLEIKPVETPDDWWIKAVKGEGGKLVITLDPVSDNMYWDNDSPADEDKYGYDCIGMMGVKKYEGYIIIRDAAGTPLATVHCIFDDSAHFGPMFSFGDKVPAGVTLTKKTLDEFSGEVAEHLSPLSQNGVNEFYELKVSSSSDSKSFVLNVPSDKHYSDMNDQWYSYTDNTGSISFDFSNVMSAGVDIRIFSDASNKSMAALVIIYE